MTNKRVRWRMRLYSRIRLTAELERIYIRCMKMMTCIRIRGFGNCKHAIYSTLSLCWCFWSPYVPKSSKYRSDPSATLCFNLQKLRRRRSLTSFCIRWRHFSLRGTLMERLCSGFWARKPANTSARRPKNRWRIPVEAAYHKFPRWRRSCSGRCTSYCSQFLSFIRIKWTLTKRISLILQLIISFKQETTHFWKVQERRNIKRQKSLILTLLIRKKLNSVPKKWIRYWQKV